MFEQNGIAFLRKFRNIPGFDYENAFQEAMVEALKAFQFTDDELKLICNAAQQLINEK